MSALLPILCAIAIPPRFAVSINDPQADLQKIRPALEWAGGADLYLRPERIERWSANNFAQRKPFDPSSMVVVGLDPEVPIKAMLPTDTGPLIVEAGVKDPKKVDAALAALSRAKAILVKGAPWAKAVIVRPTSSPRYLVARVGRRLIAHELPPGEIEPARALALFREGEATDRPKKGKGTVTVYAWDLEAIEHARIEIELSSGRIEAKAKARLGLAARLIAGDLLGRRPARRYLASLSGVAELSGTAGPGAIREALIEAGMPAAEADRARKLFAGEHAVALTKEGVLAGVMRLSGSAAKKEVAAFVARITELQPGLKIRDLDGFLLGWFPGPDPEAALELSSDLIDVAARAESPIEVKLNPRALIKALRLRARTRSGPFVPSAHLTLFEALFERILARTTSAELVASKSRGEVHATAVVQYD